MSAHSLADPQGLLRALGVPAAVLEAGIIAARNEELYRLLGGGGGAFAARVDDLVAPSACAAARAWLEAAEAAGAPAGPHRSALVAADRREIEVELSYLPIAGTAGRALLLVRLRSPFDVQQRILAQMRGRYGEIIDSADEIVVVHDIDGRFLLANRAAQKLVGRDERELLALNIKDFIPASQHAAVRERAATRVAGISDRMYSYAVTAIDAAGRERPLDVSSVPIFVDGTPVAVIVIGRFRDPRPQRERLLEAERDAAVAANLAKREFLAHMSHEVRTPINVIFGMTEMALDLEVPDAARLHIERARRAARSLLSLVEDMLEFSRVEARKYTLRPRVFDIGDRIAATVDSLAEMARERGLAIETEVAPNVPQRVVGDPDRLHQVLLNLLTNALKFTAAGRVGVRVGPASTVLPDGHHLRFAVFDTGAGLTVEQRASIFDPFQQIHRSTDPGEGTGLGLAIVRELVSLLGGQVWVESEPGRGSTFHFDVVFGRAAP